jgi:hypothetical protein
MTSSTISSPQKFSQQQEALMEESHFQIQVTETGLLLSKAKRKRDQPGFLHISLLYNTTQVSYSPITHCPQPGIRQHSFSSSAASPPRQRFIEHKAHILGFEPMSDSEGKQRL